MNGRDEKMQSTHPKGSTSGYYAMAILIILPLTTTLIMNLVFPTPPNDFGKGTMFDQIATRYDFINRALALNLDTGWRKVMVRDVIQSSLNSVPLDKKKPFRVLDLATGTADVSILLAKEYSALITATNNNDDGSSNRRSPPQKLEVLGIDPSENMIGVGRKKVTDQGLDDNIVLEIGDARDLEGVKDGYFHAVTMSFGIRNVPEKEKVLCEMHRVLKTKKGDEKGKGAGGSGGGGMGKVAILEFTEPNYENGGIMGVAARSFIRYVVPVLGAILSGAPREYMHLQNSIKKFPSPNEFVALMEGVQCGAKGQGYFQVDSVKYLNFGSVVLYLASPMMSK